VTSTQGSSQSSQQSGGAKEIRRKANERVGQWVNRKYCLESLLGVGGMATVYAARHRNGSRMALKILHAEFAREEGVKKRFLREGYVANKVDHPGVVRILDDDETEQGEPYLVMELLEGQTLQQLWKRRNRKLAPVEALNIAADVLDCLVGFHEQNIIHRDIKPANIFITHDDVVKLLDFGVAQLREHGEAMTRAGTALGTPSFMSPEQAMGKSDQLDGRSDIFSIGATLYACLSGKRLHHGKSDNEAFILAATQPAPSLARSAPELPTEVIACVDKSLQWDRRKRYRTAAQMRDACRDIVGQLGGTPRFSRPPQVEPSQPSVPTMGATPAARQVVHPGSAPLPNITGGGAPPAPHSGSSPSHPAVSQPAPRIPGQARSQAPAQSPLSQQSPPVAHTPHSGISTQQPRSKAPPPPKRRPSAVQPMPVAAPSDKPEVELETKPREEGDSPLEPMFERFEKALPSVRHYGLDHPEGLAKVRNVHRAMLDALREMPKGIHFFVHPFCFSEGTKTVWEPGPPNDQVPYAMASSGVEEVRILPGVSEEEVRAFLQAIVVDPQLGLMDGDIGAALWEAGMDHIVATVRDDMADADAREQIRFFAESEEVAADVKEELAKVVTMMAQTANPNLRRQDKAEAAAIALQTDTEAFNASKTATTVLRLGDATAQALGAQLNLDPDQWLDRFYEVTPDALVDAAMREDLEILFEEIRSQASRLVRAVKWTELLDIHDRLVERLASHPGREEFELTPAHITQQVFGWERIEMAFKMLNDEEGRYFDEDVEARVVQAITDAIPQLEGDMVGKFMRLANDMPPGRLRDLALTYVDRYLDGHQQVIIDMLDDLDPPLAQRMLARVAETLGDRAEELLKPILMSRNQALRCEATALLAPTPEMLGKQLVRLLSSSDRALRSASLTTMLRYNVRLAGPGLVGVIEDDGFSARPRDEQQQMLEVLYELNPPRGEALLTSMLSRHGMLADEALDQSRTLAAEVLGERADSGNPLEALDDAARLRPWNTQALRMAAGHAADQIRQRLAGGRKASG
jgi:serine/threonine protein kinase